MRNEVVMFGMALDAFSDAMREAKEKLAPNVWVPPENYDKTKCAAPEFVMHEGERGFETVRRYSNDPMAAYRTHYERPDEFRWWPQLEPFAHALARMRQHLAALQQRE